MNISDAEFINFYQESLGILAVEPDNSVKVLFGLPGVGEEEEWYKKSIAALTRLGMSGLISCYGPEDDIRLAVREMYRSREDRMWLGCLFSATDSGEELARKFRLDDEEPYQRVVPGFREELGRIFDEHGVGFGVDLPYDKLFSLKSD
ncbi:hypothetical protein [Bombella favorum]|uniref:VOC domain-containing protein n=2 Tax=Bombella TaxID=1654741 RepID=A0ABR5ZPX1_9PROT|nr:hypothetical protein [Bombella favorum]MBA5726378.1 hypothetical protein [Bombella favorum]